jgi:hypothetical protein
MTMESKKSRSRPPRLQFIIYRNSPPFFRPPPIDIL